MIGIHRWDDWHRAGSAIVSEATGWALGDGLTGGPDDDAERLLAWARHYLPLILAHSETYPQ